METIYDRMRADARNKENEPVVAEDATTQAPETVPETPVEATTPVESTEPITPESTEETPSSDQKVEKSLDINTINEYYGTSFESTDSLKEALGAKDQLKDFETQLSERDNELKTSREKFNELLDSVDVEKIYPNKETIALTQLKEKYPNADFNTLDSIRKKDLAAIDKLEALVIIDKLNVPSKVSDLVRQQEILRSLGIDEEDLSELSESDKYRIEREFTSKASTLQEIKDFQPEIRKYDLESEKAARTQKNEADKQVLQNHNEEALKILLEGYKETNVNIKDNGEDIKFSYKVDDEFKKEHFNEILQDLTNEGVKITTANMSEVTKEIDDRYKLKNLSNIVNDAVKQAVSKEKERIHNELHTDSPTNKTEAPPRNNGAGKTVMESYRTGAIKRN